MTLLTFPSKLREVPDGYISGPDLAHAAHISYRQLDYWSRTGYLHPLDGNPGSGYVRAYPASDVALASLVARLLGAGFHPKPAFDLAHQLLTNGHAELAGIRIDLPEEL